jgi:glucan phosphoethanolaminetransferase (alkaline phosphatase superfamily)
MKAFAKPWLDLISLLALTFASSYWPAKIAYSFVHSFVSGNSVESGQSTSPKGWQGFVLAYAVIAWLCLSAVVIPLCGQSRIGADESAASKNAFKVLTLINAALAWACVIMLFWLLSTFGH